MHLRLLDVPDPSGVGDTYGEGPVTEGRMAKDWNPDEIDVVLDAYLAMLRAEFREQSYVKAEYNRQVQRAIGRARGSVEFKFQNVSAALQDLGLAWIPGFKPKANYQDELRRQLEQRRRDGDLDWLPAA